MAYSAGPDTPGVDPDPNRKPSAVRLHLHKLATKVEYGTKLYVAYDYTRRVGYDEVAPKAVLEADAFPFDRFRPVRTFHPEQLGQLMPTPQRNTRYRLRYLGTTPNVVTKPRTVRVTLPFHIHFDFPTAHTMTGRAVLHGPHDVVTAHRKIAYYAYFRSQRRSVRLGITTFRAAGANRATSTSPRYALPPDLGPHDRVYGCLIEHHDDGFDRFNRNIASCGNR